MEQNPNPDERLGAQRRRSVFRWIRAGGVVIAFEADSNSTRIQGLQAQEPLGFGLSETVLAGETLQITTNLRAIGSACRRLTDYVVYLWNCERQAEYQLSLGRQPMSLAKEGLIARIAPACFAGGRPQAHLEIGIAGGAIPGGGSVAARLILPRGLCAFVHQRDAAAQRRTSPRLNLEPKMMSESDLMDAMLETNG